MPSYKRGVIFIEGHGVPLALTPLEKMVTKKRDLSEELQREAEILRELNLQPDEIEFVLYNRLKSRRMREY